MIRKFKITQHESPICEKALILADQHRRDCSFPQYNRLIPADIDDR
jgi:hypothetical protein